MFESIELLKNVRLDENNQLPVFFKDELFMVSFSWNAPCAPEDIDSVLQENTELWLPDDYIEFLTTFSNGCKLFNESKWGLSGVELFSIEDKGKKQHAFDGLLYSGLGENRYVFGQILYDSTALVFEKLKAPQRGRNYRILETGPLDPPEDWDQVSRSFEKFIYYFIQAQGGKYWLWSL